MKANFLCIDDDAVSRAKMQAILEEKGTCQTAESGGQAVALFESGLEKGKGFDLITLDIGLPDYDGVDLLRYFRKLEIQKAIPLPDRAKIIMVTSQSDKERVLSCLQAGCNDYIVKPFDVTILAAKLEKLGL